MRTLVMKFGGASVATPEHFSLISDMIIQRKKEYQRIAIVVSAMGNTTDQLIALAKKVNPTPPQREYDMLVTVGERISIALLAMALAVKQQEAISFTGSQSGIITCSTHAEARIIDVRPHRLLPALNQGKIVIVAGFQGVSRPGEITTLGRGGSDTTAVALGIAVEAEVVEFIKDVPGIYEKDPKHHPEAKMYDVMNYQQALDIAFSGAKVLHPRCIQLAGRNGLPLQIQTFHSVDDLLAKGTRICDPLATRPLVPVYEEETVSSLACRL